MRSLGGATHDAIKSHAIDLKASMITRSRPLAEYDAILFISYAVHFALWLGQQSFRD